jgi:hypothetical protein
MNQERKNQLIVGLLVVNLIMTFYMGNKIINELSSTNDDINDMVNDLNYTVSHIESDIVHQVEELLEDQNNNIANIHYEMISYDSLSRKAEFSVTITLKDSTGITEVLLTYEGENDGAKESVILNPDGNLTFSGKFTLAIADDYNISLIGVGNDGDDKLLTKVPLDIDLKSEYLDERTRYLQGEGSIGSHSFSEKAIFELRILDEKVFGIEKVEMIIMDEESIIDTKDITNEIFIGSDLQILEEQLYSSDIYQGGIDANNAHASAEAIKVEGKYSSDHSRLSTQYILAYFSGKYSDFAGINQDSDFRLSYKFTYKDGYVQDIM